MSDSNFKEGSTFLIDFLENFSGLMEYQLNHIRDTMEGTVDNVLEGVKHISEATEKNRQVAEDVLEKAYLNPDAETQVLVDGLQQMIDDLPPQEDDEQCDACAI